MFLLSLADIISRESDRLLSSSFLVSLTREKLPLEIFSAKLTRLRIRREILVTRKTAVPVLIRIIAMLNNREKRFVRLMDSESVSRRCCRRRKHRDAPRTRQRKRAGYLLTNPSNLLTISDPARIQTLNRLIRSQVLYSIELRGRRVGQWAVAHAFLRAANILQKV